ncbi:MAG TPA: Gfo/Idh/MocA family oxidoreductase [Anaerolineae bacterium]|nr:Gfo/Idh/MocA family oxidoreductase [Anaerolineae bacterium]
MTNDKLRLGVIGAGLLGARHARVWHELPDTELVAICDLNPARAAEIANQYNALAFSDYHKMLDKPELDAVSIATPDHLHREPVLAALAAHKHVLQEKPLATNAADARAIVQASQASNCIVMVNYSQRFVPDHAWIHNAIARGEIGTPHFVLSIKHDNISVPMGMIRAWSAETSPLYFMSSHDLDLVHWFLGQDPVSAFAYQSRGTLDALGIPVHDGLNALIQFQNNISANFHSSWIHPNTYPRLADGYMQIIGSAGALTYTNRTRTAELFNAHGGQKIEFVGPHTADVVDGKITGAFVASLQHFLNCIRAQREPDTAPRRVLPSALAQAAILDSLHTGQPTPIA